MRGEQRVFNTHDCHDDKSFDENKECVQEPNECEAVNEMSPEDDLRMNVKPVEVSVDHENEKMSSQVTPSVDSVGKLVDKTVR